MDSIDSNSLMTEVSNKESEIAKKPTGQIAEEVNYVQEASLSRKIEFEKGLPLSFGFVDNKIFTIPFSFTGYLSFFGNKYSQTPLNICILIVFIYYLIS